MKLERTFQGLEATLRPTGLWRFGPAAFLLVWLAGWIVGELAVLGMLLWGGWALATGRPPGEGWGPLETAPSLAVGLFLLVWLAFWTVGGVAAWRELLRLLFGVDRLVAGPDLLEIERSYGLFRRRQRVSRDQIRRFFQSASGRVLSAETTRGVIELTRLGTPEDLGTLASTLNGEFKLAPDPARDGVLPAEWTELVSPEGEPILLQDPVARRRQATLMWGVTLVVAAVAGVVVNATRAQVSLGALAAILTALAGFSAWGAYRLAFCRDEWVLGRRRLVLQRRTRGGVVRRFEADVLQLRQETDSDGDLSYRLAATRVEFGEARTAPAAGSRERQVWSRSGDATEVRNLGLWIAHRCGIAFEDCTTRESRAEEIERLKRALAASGRFGRWAGRMLDRLGPRQR